jgi:pilus assembly protein FimV
VPFLRKFEVYKGEAMNKSMKISGLVWALLLASGVADAAGLGKLSVQSALGQPLRAEIELLSVNKDELADITAKLASPDAFKQARIDRVEALGTLRFTVDQRANGQPVIRITSTSGVPDPFLDLLIELNWSSGRLIREYTILLDPSPDTKPAEPVKPVAVPESGRNGDGKPAHVAVAETQKAKPVAQAAPAPAVPKRYGPVKYGETLRGIAGKVKSSEVSLEQMMVGLYQANKGAFFGDNMNRLKRGQVLNVPDAESAKASSPREAARTVKGHVVEWHAYRRKLAGMAEAAPQVEEKPTTGRITPKADEKPAPAAVAPKDVLKLSKGEPGTAAGKPDARTQERLHSLEEELAAKGRALQEAQDRVGQLERTVRDMQKLLELKAQEAAKAPTPAPVPAPVPAEPPKIEAPAEPAPAPAPAPEAQPKPTPAPAPAPLPVAEPSSSWISTFIGNPLYIGGVVAALLLSALLWMMMVGSRRRQGLNKFEDSIMTGGEFKNNAVFNPPAGGAAPVTGASTEGSMLLTDFSRLGMGAIDSHEVDPIAEAEVYMAYGRDAQAEEILREALGKDPSRHEIALKLLEIYASRKDTLAFETTASELYAGLGGQNTPVWQRAAEMGRSIDPENPLYRVTPTVAMAGQGVAAATAAAAVAKVAAIPAPAPATVVEPSYGAAESDELGKMESWEAPAMGGDNALEFVSTPEADWGEQVSEAPVAMPEPAGSLDFEIAPELTESEFEIPELPLEPEPVEPAPAQEIVEALDAEPALDLPTPESLIPAPSLDFEPLAEEIEAPAQSVPELDLSGIDLDLVEETLEPETIEAVPVEAAPEDVSLEFEPSTDFEPVEAAVPEEIALAEMPESAPAEAMPGEGAIDPALREEVNTKLDLAKAYLEMGDREGAREILQEVLNEGDDGQKSEAGKLMAEAG